MENHSHEGYRFYKSFRSEKLGLFSELFQSFKGLRAPLGISRFHVNALKAPHHHYHHHHLRTTIVETTIGPTNRYQLTTIRYLYLFVSETTKGRHGFPFVAQYLCRTVTYCSVVTEPHSLSKNSLPFSVFQAKYFNKFRKKKKKKWIKA